MTIIGYARVSTREQNPESQEAELRAAGAAQVFTDHGESSRIADRPQWIACQDYLREGDTLMVRALDRLAGGEVMALQIVHELGERGIQLKSLTEPEIDTTTPMGRALFGVVAVFVQLRVDTIRENTRRGLAHARAQGRIGGRPTVMPAERLRAAEALRSQGHTLSEIAQALGVSRSSVWRALNSPGK
ncbi:recombinase family protein [Nesterenkonia marinintestina]|uniref:recombinase family protein n=1 Tax=Nesterenkonia marinintestina TaxID=2979865 RepID=UPI0021C09C0A|nr:recombinase family protein [Nesterenkonia sp. GX14115]